MAGLGWSWWGRVPYREALQRQLAHRAAVQSKLAPGMLFLLEHDPVVTLGRRGGEILPAAHPPPGVEIVRTQRGGLATAHEPGQLVGYLVADIRRPGVRRVVEALEEGLIAWLASRGLPAGRRDGFPGAWCGPRKVAAVGLHVERGVTAHGFALNLVNDLGTFAAIVPCGIRDAEVASVVGLGGGAISPTEAAPGVARSVLDAIGAVL